MQKQNFRAQINEIVKLVPTQLTSFTVFKWTYPFSLILALTTTATKIQGPSEYMKWLIIGFLAHTSMIPFVVYGKNRNSRFEQISLLVLMGAARGATIGLLAPLFNLTDSMPLVVRIANTTFAVVYWFIAGSILVEYGVSFQRKVKLLLTKIIEKNFSGIPEAAESSTHDLTRVIAHLQARILDVIGESPTKTDLEKASAEIDSLVQSHLRPLAKSQWRDGKLIWIRAGIFSTLRQTLSVQKFPVVAVILLTFPFAAVTQSSRMGLLSAALVLGVWIALVLIGEKFIYRSQFSSTNVFQSNLYFLALLIFFIYPTTFVINYSLPFLDHSPTLTMVQGYVLSAITQSSLFIIGALVVSLSDDQEFAFQFLSDVIAKGELDNLIRQTQSGNTDAQFAQYVHAEVQAQLLACKLLLLKAAQSEFELFPPEITRQITERMEKIKQPYVRPAAQIITQRLEEISKSWSGLAEISYDLPPELSQHQPYSKVTSQLIEEAIVNSIRHGKATKISVRGSKTLDLIEVSVTDNGKFENIANEEGLGSILFNTFAHDWSINSVGNNTVLTFTVSTKDTGAKI
jgi:hypothetical protein